MNNITALQEILAQPQQVVILSHRNPDGDAMGSSLGLQGFLAQQGHTIQVIFPSEYPEFVAWMPNANKSLIYDLDPEASAEAIQKATLIFALDFNALDRIDPMEKLVEASTAKKVMIDHHMNPQDFVDFMMSETSASSACELVYEFIALLGQTDLITPAVASCLYTGIITDTGSFRYAITPRTMEVAGALLAKEADTVFIQDVIYNSMSEKVLRLLGHCLYNRLEIYDDLKTGIIWLSKQDFEEFDIQRGDTEGVVNYILKLKNIQVAAFIKEQPTIVKISFRSKGDFSVQEMASSYFKGGGHKNASGGSFYGTVDACKERILRSIKNQWKKTEA